jgi:hypothetical protein
VKDRAPTDGKVLRSMSLLLEALRRLTPDEARSLEGPNLDVAVAFLVLGLPVRRQRKRTEMRPPELAGLWVSLAHFGTSLDAVDYAEAKVIEECGEPPYYAALCEVVGGPLPPSNLYRARPSDRARACVMATIRARRAVA